MPKGHKAVAVDYQRRGCPSHFVELPSNGPVVKKHRETHAGIAHYLDSSFLLIGDVNRDDGELSGRELFGELLESRKLRDARSSSRLHEIEQNNLALVARKGLDQALRVTERELRSRAQSLLSP